ncbi:hypothetical protein [Microcoleus sp. CAWBG58]|uniref:hypothetical protein n=1 Tax=Microcoleus sp. CAWBG58 TaxID=2841651 RepID=UPI0025EC1917|nr:hypothetical protein [Microcoleus sp. CAWBG58]
MILELPRIASNFIAIGPWKIADNLSIGSLPLQSGIYPREEIYQHMAHIDLPSHRNKFS